MDFYKKYLFLTSLTCLCFGLFAQQKEANVWYFGGKQEINFNSGVAVHSYNTTPMYSSGSCAAMSDANGIPLLYTNGIEVFDKTHTIMPNGAGLVGNNSGLCIIVPHPTAANLYYIFTAPFYDQTTQGIMYHLVDINQNGGLGDVILKNQSLNNSAVEKIVGIQNANDDGYWVIGHEWNSNKFIAWEINTGGLNTVPVISAVGSAHGGIILNSRGGMAISPDGKKLALNISEDAKIEIFDFDNSTGQVSNPITITNYFTVTGMEFSPDSKKLYAQQNDHFSGIPVPYRIIQFDLSAGTSANDIKNSAVVVGTHTSVYGGIQLGPDCKIYAIAMESWPDTVYLDIIHAPNEKGIACGYQKKGLMISNGTGNDGLPKFIPKFLNAEKCSFTAKLEQTNISCYGKNDGTATASPQGGTAPYTYDWSPGNYADASISGLAPGTYTVVITDNGNNTYVDSIIISEATPIQINLTDTFLICKEDTVTLSPVVSGGTPEYLYNWNNNAYTDSTLTVTPLTNTAYILEITDSSGCKNSDTAHIIISDDIKATVTAGTAICEGDSTVLLAGGGANYQWLPPTGLSNPNISDPIAFPSTTTNYEVIVSSSGSCKADTATVTIIVEAKIAAFAGNDTSICEGESLTLTATGGNNFQWNNGATSQNITVNPSNDNTYRVMISGNICPDDSDEVNISVRSIPVVTISSDTTIKSGESIALNASGGGTYSWAPTDGLDNPSINNPVASPETSTTYTLTINKDGCSVDAIVRINVISDCGEFFIPNAFSPNGDGVNDTLYVRGNCIDELRFSIFDRWGEKMFETTDIQKGWDGRKADSTGNTDNYTYLLEVSLNDASTIRKKGNVYLIR